MAGVVRRDGLREAVTALRDEWQRQSQGHARCMRINCSTCVTNDVAARLTAVLDAVPEVPPDPPAADLADDLALDYIRAYYALVTAARALLDAMTRFGPDDSGQLWDAAQALRALVGDETPGTGEGA